MALQAWDAQRAQVVTSAVQIALGVHDDALASPEGKRQLSSDLQTTSVLTAALQGRTMAAWSKCHLAVGVGLLTDFCACQILA
jgi:hypothetical protein